MAARTSGKCRFGPSCLYGTGRPAGSGVERMLGSKPPQPPCSHEAKSPGPNWTRRLVHPGRARPWPRRLQGPVLRRGVQRPEVPNSITDGWMIWDTYTHIAPSCHLQKDLRGGPMGKKFYSSIWGRTCVFPYLRSWSLGSRPLHSGHHSVSLSRSATIC